MDLTQLIVIFCASVVTSTFGTLVGGSSLITIPLLIVMGLPPHTAISTDRIGTAGISMAGLYSFHRKGMVRYGLAFTVGIPCLIGGFIGANLALQISPELLKKLIVALTVILLIFVMTNPRLGVQTATNRPLTAGRCVLGAFLGFIVGIYGGFYGAGAGTLLAYIMIIVFRQTFLESAANNKVAGIMMSATSAATYAYHGAIHIPLAVVMFVGCCIGSYMSAQYSDRLGNIWIKRLFIAMIVLMAVKLLMDA
jgi:uncharacterized protein